MSEDSTTDHGRLLRWAAVAALRFLLLFFAVAVFFQLMRWNYIRDIQMTEIVPVTGAQVGYAILIAVLILLLFLLYRLEVPAVDDRSS